MVVTGEAEDLAVEEEDVEVADDDVSSTAGAPLRSGAPAVIPSIANTARPPAKANPPTIFTSVRVRRRSAEALAEEGRGVSASAEDTLMVPYPRLGLSGEPSILRECHRCGAGRAVADFTTILCFDWCSFCDEESQHLWGDCVKLALNSSEPRQNTTHTTHSRRGRVAALDRKPLQ